MDTAKPLTATDSSTRVILKNDKGEAIVWYWRGKYLIKDILESGQYRWYVFGKWDEQDKVGKDFLYVSNSLSSIKTFALLLNEILPHELVEELHPDSE